MKSRKMTSVWMIGVAMLLAACGGGGDGGGGTSPVAAPLSGVFIDSEVGGLGWRATPSGLSGKTDATGHFQYRQGDQVQFHLDGRDIGLKVDGAPKVTAHSLFGATTLLDSRVVRCSRLLLTLGGGAPVNGVIQLPATIPAALVPVLDFTPANVNFDTTVLPGTTLVSDANATTHLQSSFSTVTVNFAGAGSGTVSSTPAGINNCATTCSNVFIKGDSVTLTAIGSGFAGWSAGTGNAASCAGIGTCTFTPTSDSSVTATFNVPPPPTLATLIVGNGTVACSANGGPFGSCAASYPSGTALVLQPTANVGSSFTGWTNGTGNATVCPNTANNCSMTLNANSTVTANFVLNTVTFSLSTNPLSSNGGGGTISCSTTGGAPFGTCAPFYNAGTNLTLQASPDAVSNFAGWSGACSGTGLCQFPSFAANSIVTANFNRPTLTVGLLGVGTVTSNFGGINCGATCSAVLNKGTVVTLTAIGTGFTSWSGCTPVGGTPTQCTVTVTANTNVTATFGAVSALPNFKFIGAKNRELLAIDPALPGTSTPVKVGNINVVLPSTGCDECGASVLTGASYDPGTTSFTTLQSKTILFVSGQKLYRASTLISSGVPGSLPANEPHQVSSKSDIVSCGAGSVIDPVNPNPIVGFSTPGLNGICDDNDDGIFLMHLNDPDSTAPVQLLPGTDITGDDTSVYNLTTGLVDQVILRTRPAGDLQWMDDTLAPPTNIINGTGIGSVTIVARQANKVFLLSNDKLYIYTPSIHTLAPTPVVTADPGTTFLSRNNSQARALADLSDIFLVQSNGHVYKVPLTTPAGQTVTGKHFTAPVGTNAVDVRLTANKIIIETGSSPQGNNGPSPCSTSNPPTCNNGIIAVGKTTPSGAATTIEAAASNNAINLQEPFNNYVLYNLNTGNASSGAMLRIEDASSGSLNLSPGGFWTNAGGVSSSANIVNLSQPRTSAIFVQAFNGVPPQTGTIKVITSPTGSPVTLGTVTASPALSQFPNFRDSLNRALIGIGQLQGSTNTQPFFVDTTVPNSLAPVSTPAPAAKWVEME